VVKISHSLPSRTKPPNLRFPLPTFHFNFFTVLATAMSFTHDKDGNLVPSERDTYKFYDINGKCLLPYPHFRSNLTIGDFRKAITIWPYIDTENRVSPSTIDEVERILLDIFLFFLKIIYIALSIASINTMMLMQPLRLWSAAHALLIPLP
jgi:hypothetical protein